MSSPDLFTSLPVRRTGAPRRSPAFGASLGGHAAVLAAGLLVLALRRAPLPEPALLPGVILYQPPGAPPAPALPLGRGALDARRAVRPESDAVDVQTPVATVPDERAAPSPELDPGGSPTGAASGSSEGMEGGEPDGVPGGLPGGGPDGVPGGVPWGSGHGPVSDYDRPPRPIHQTQPVYPQEAFVKKIDALRRGQPVAARASCPITFRIR